MLHKKIIDIKKDKIKTSEAEAFIKSSSYGASIIFNGTVRNINENKEVVGITYDSHDELVLKSFDEIYKEATVKLKILDKAVLTIVNQVDAMKTMVNEFSEYARAPKLNLELTDINTLADKYLRLASRV